MKTAHNEVWTSLLQRKPPGNILSDLSPASKTPAPLERGPQRRRRDFANLLIWISQNEVIETARSTGSETNRCTQQKRARGKSDFPQLRSYTHAAIDHHDHTLPPLVTESAVPSVLERERLGGRPALRTAGGKLEGSSMELLVGL